MSFCLTYAHLIYLLYLKYLLYLTFHLQIILNAFRAALPALFVAVCGAALCGAPRRGASHLPTRYSRFAYNMRAAHF